MTPGQHDAAMIDLGHRRTGLIGNRQAGPFDQRSAAGRTPIRHSLFAEHCTALAANPFHSFKITGFSRFFAQATLELCTLPFGWWPSTWTARYCPPLRRSSVHARRGRSRPRKRRASPWPSPPDAARPTPLRCSKDSASERIRPSSRPMEQRSALWPEILWPAAISSRASRADSASYSGLSGPGLHL